MTRRQLFGTAIGTVLCLGLAGPAVAQVKPQSQTAPPMRTERTLRADTRCGAQTLVVCTQQRVAALQQLSATLKQAAAQKPSSPPADAKEREMLERYDRWLTQQSQKAAQLASEGQRALAAAASEANQQQRQAVQMQEMQMSFSLQYLQLQNSMQAESREFAMISNIMKTKHDTVKNSISNIR